MPDQTTIEKNIAAGFRKLFNSVPKMGGAVGAVEGLTDTRAELSTDALVEKAAKSEEQINRIIEEFLGNDTKLKLIAKKIAVEGKDALKAVAADDNSYLEKNPYKATYLEVIVRTDGTRPSFLIQNGKVNFQSSPESDWAGVFATGGDCLTHAIECVGRINDAGGYQVGTGFLIHQDLIITNRHVLQEIATLENVGGWKMKPNYKIDFGFEFRAQKSLNARGLESVLFVPPDYIDPYDIDHFKLDLVVIKLSPAPIEMTPIQLLSFGLATEWATPGEIIFTIGYPGNPGLYGLQTYGTLLDQLFKSTFGYKRIAPGEIIVSEGEVKDWTVTHDATTLGGNSGSLIVTVNNACIAAGLHYGGKTNTPRENWGHILGGTLDGPNIVSGNSLRSILQQNNVKLVDFTQ